MKWIDTQEEFRPPTCIMCFVTMRCTEHTWDVRSREIILSSALKVWWYAYYRWGILGWLESHPEHFHQVKQHFFFLPTFNPNSLLTSVNGIKRSQQIPQTSLFLKKFYCMLDCLIPWLLQARCIFKNWISRHCSRSNLISWNGFWKISINSYTSTE